MFISDNARKTQAQIIGEGMVQDRKDFEEACERIDRFQSSVVKFYLENSDRDDAEEMTCAQFDINQDTLNFILADDLVNSMMS